MIDGGLLYIDPGTGSLIGSTLMGLGLVVVFSVKSFFYRAVSFFTGKKNFKDCNFEGKLVFFNEGKNYWNCFKPVLDEMIKEKQPFVYLTCDKDDPGLKMNYEGAELIYLGSFQEAIFSLNKLKAKVCVMTTPQLEILMLKRSKDVEHYVNLMHSPSDIHDYKKFAFDYFDSVLCTSSFQIEELRYLEELRKTRVKELFETGCTYYQGRREHVKEIKNESPVILLAPTWGAKGFLLYVNKMLEILLKLNFKVIFRPHPQSFISEKETIKNIENKYEKLIEIDKTSDNTATLNKADIMICDFSGVLYDFAFIHKKPVILIKGNKEINAGNEEDDFKIKNSIYYFIDEVGVLLDIKDIQNLGEIIAKTLEKKVDESIVDKYIYNLHNAGEVAGKQILEIYRRNL